MAKSIPDIPTTSFKIEGDNDTSEGEPVSSWRESVDCADWIPTVTPSPETFENGLLDLEGRTSSLVMSF